jgi:MFS family permease
VPDIRQEDEYAAGPLPRAVHIELGSFSQHTGQVQPHPVTVMCGHGERAMLQSLGIALIAATNSFIPWAITAVLTGSGSALVYPALLAVIVDVAFPSCPARSVGVYRLWRDLGYALGALLAGITADLLGVRQAIWIVAAITTASGVIVALRMYETRRAQP